MVYIPANKSIVAVVSLAQCLNTRILYNIVLDHVGTSPGMGNNGLKRCSMKPHK